MEFFWGKMCQWFNNNKTVSNPLTVKKLWELSEENGTKVMMTHVYDMTLLGELHGHKFHCVMDTGAQLNALPKYIVERLGMEDMVDHSIDCHFTGLVGSGVSYGIIPHLDLSIGNIHCPTGFIVIDHMQMHDIILGTSFMKFYKIKIDFETNKIFINGKNVTVTLTERDRYIL